MNTEFNILWFEDNDEWYEVVSSEIEEYIKDLCFYPNFIRFRSILDDDIKDVLYKYSFDLIFADLNLDKSDQGNDAIQLIRKNNILADALFYSTDGIYKIQSVMQADVLEGVYLSIRDEYLFPDKAKKLIDKAVKRSEDILNVRGMLMDNVSEFDEKLKESIRKALTISLPNEIDEFNRYAFKKVMEQIAVNGSKAKSLQQNFILNALENSFLIDSYKLSMIVNKIFKDKYPTYNKMDDFHSNYSKFILKERNQLAHAKKEPEANGIFYFQDNKGNKTEYTSEKCKEIREHINNYNELLNGLIDIIK